MLGGHAGSPLCVLPELRRSHLLLELRQPRPQRSYVKDNPRAASSARGSQPDAGASSRLLQPWPWAHAIRAPTANRRGASGAVALLELLAAAAPARVVAPQLLLIAEHALLDDRQGFPFGSVFVVALRSP